MEYQKSNFGGPKYNVTDSEEENDLGGESKSGEPVSPDPNITDLYVGSIKQAGFKDRHDCELV